MSTDDRLVVLDVHGVIFTNPLSAFLVELAERHGREPAEVMALWTDRLRRPFWLGELAVERMWPALFPGADSAALTAELEQRYAKGPLFSALDAISQPIWLLSNHRTSWLLPRLARFGLADRFERVYVSDSIGHVKPDLGAFRLVHREADGRRVTYVDDKAANVSAAAAVFGEALHVTLAVTRFLPRTARTTRS